MYACMCVGGMCTWVCKHVGACAGQRPMLVFFISLPHFLALNVELTGSARHGGIQVQGSTFLSFSSQNHCAWVLGSKLGSWCSGGKHFTDWDIPPASAKLKLLVPIFRYYGCHSSFQSFWGQARGLKSHKKSSEHFLRPLRLWDLSYFLGSLVAQDGVWSQGELTEG